MKFGSKEMSSLYMIFDLTFLMHTPVQLNGLLDGVPNEEEYATGCHIRFQKIFRFVSRLEKSA